MYYDRLVDGNDRQWLFDLMQKMVKQHFKDDFQTVFKHLSVASKVTDDNMRSLMFGDYMKPDAVSALIELLKYCLDEILPSTCIIMFNNHFLIVYIKALIATYISTLVTIRLPSLATYVHVYIYIYSVAVIVLPTLPSCL